MIYSPKTASWMTEDVVYDIRNVSAYNVNRFSKVSFLTSHSRYALGLPQYTAWTLRRRKRPGSSSRSWPCSWTNHWIRDDEVFAHERLHVQLAANLILAGATATRPGALIGQLRYEDLEFQLFPPLSGEERPRVILRVSLKNVKRSAGESEPKDFAFCEDDILIYDPIIPIMALAFADRLSKKLNKERLERAIKEFHDSVHVTLGCDARAVFAPPASVGILVVECRSPNPRERLPGLRSVGQGERHAVRASKERTHSLHSSAAPTQRRSQYTWGRATGSSPCGGSQIPWSLARPKAVIQSP